MYSVAVNLRSPREWRLKVQKFISRLEDSFKNRLVSVIALPSPEDSLYDSNVLVMLDKLKQGDLREVASLAPDEVSPLVVPKEDREAVEAFFLRGGTRVAGSEVKIR